MSNELVRQTEELVGQAQKRGASQAEVSVSVVNSSQWSSSRISSGRKGSIESQNATSIDLAIRVFNKDGQCGTVSGVVDSIGAGGALIDEAISKADAAAAEPQAGPCERYDASGRGLNILDPRHARLTDEGRREILSWNLNSCRGVSARIRPGEFTLEERENLRLYTSSLGIQRSENSTWYQIRGRAHHQGRPAFPISGKLTSRQFSDVASRPLGAMLGRVLESAERAVKMPAKALPLVLEPEVVAEILLRMAPAFDAARIANQRSFLCGKINHAIAPSGLHVVDDASVPSGLNTRSFDDWGVPPVPVPLIQEGVFAGLYLDGRQARRRGVRPSGHMSAFGEIATGNLVARPGSRSRNMIFADLRQYLVATDLFEPMVLDLETGALEMKVRLFVDSEDRARGRLGIHLIKTDVLTLLSQIKIIGSDQTRFGSVDVGTWVLDGVTLTPCA